MPLGNREVTGVVWGEGSGDVDDSRLKDVIRRFDVAPLSDVARDFIDWVARYVMSPPGAVLRMTLRVPSALEPPKPVIAYRRSASWEDGATRITPARQRVLDLLADGPPRTAKDLTQEAGCGRRGGQGGWPPPARWRWWRCRPPAASRSRTGGGPGAA